MGYSIAAPARSIALRNDMLLLLDQEYRRWPKVAGYPERNSYLRGPLAHDLSYHHGRCYIGYDYNAGGAEREYAFCIVRWLAITIGRKTPSGLPYYVYDGDEVIALLVNADHLNPKCSTVDRWGIPIETPDARKIRGVWDKLAEMLAFEEQDMLPVIRAEIQRLDTIWQRCHPT